jgi:hypothetical protein
LLPDVHGTVALVDSLWLYHPRLQQKEFASVMGICLLHWYYFSILLSYKLIQDHHVDNQRIPHVFDDKNDQEVK